MNFYNQEISSTTFDDNLYQELLTTSATKTRPLLHFCFDHLKKGSDGVVNVALTCPKVNFTGEFAKVHKCCPFGKITHHPTTLRPILAKQSYFYQLYFRVTLYQAFYRTTFEGQQIYRKIEFLENFYRVSGQFCMILYL